MKWRNSIQAQLRIGQSCAYDPFGDRLSYHQDVPELCCWSCFWSRLYHCIDNCTLDATRATWLELLGHFTTSSFGKSDLTPVILTSIFHLRAYARCFNDWGNLPCRNFSIRENNTVLHGKQSAKKSIRRQYGNQIIQGGGLTPFATSFNTLQSLEDLGLFKSSATVHGTVQSCQRLEE